MKALYDLKDKLHEELEEIAKKREMSAGDLEAVHKLTDTIKNIDKICMMEEDGGYSNAGGWSAEMRGNYGMGHSYAGRHRDSRGRYSRDGNGGGYSRNGSYSRHGDIVEKLEEMMGEATNDRQRNAIRHCIDSMS